jgi:excisionase family DNA binding protein
VAADPHRLELTLPPEVLEALAQRAAELVVGMVAAGPARAEPWISVEQAAAHLCCPKSRVYSLVSARRIPYQKDGSRVLFKASELDAWVAEGGGIRP